MRIVCLSVRSVPAAAGTSDKQEQVVLYELEHESSRPAFHASRGPWTIEVRYSHIASLEELLQAAGAHRHPWGLEALSHYAPYRFGASGRPDVLKERSRGLCRYLEHALRVTEPPAPPEFRVVLDEFVRRHWLGGPGPDTQAQRKESTAEAFTGPQTAGPAVRPRALKANLPATPRGLFSPERIASANTVTSGASISMGDEHSRWSSTSNYKARSPALSPWSPEPGFSARTISGSLTARECGWSKGSEGQAKPLSAPPRSPERVSTANTVTSGRGLTPVEGRTSSRGSDGQASFCIETTYAICSDSLQTIAEQEPQMQLQEERISGSPWSHSSAHTVTSGLTTGDSHIGGQSEASFCMETAHDICNDSLQRALRLESVTPLQDSRASPCAPESCKSVGTVTSGFSIRDGLASVRSDGQASFCMEAAHSICADSLQTLLGQSTELGTRPLSGEGAESSLQEATPPPALPSPAVSPALLTLPSPLPSPTPAPTPTEFLPTPPHPCLPTHANTSTTRFPRSDMAHQGLPHNARPAGLLLLALLPTALAAGRGLRLQRQPPLAPLLEMQEVTQDLSSPSMATSFGPDKCIRLLKSNLGTCVIHVACASQDVSKVDFSFVCIKKGASPAQHSYGVGGFDSDEVFDSGIVCDSCTTVSFATTTNGKLVHNEMLGPHPNHDSGSEQNPLAKAPSPADAALAKAPSPADPAPAGDLAKAPSPADPAEGLAKAPSPGKPYKGVDVDRLPPTPAPPSQELAAFFGPSACVSTYLSPQGTCMIQTRCKGVDISNFAIGVTCLDKTGDYTRYIFGKNGFDDEEIFDTTLPCQACIGVGEQPSYQLSGLVPKTIVEDLSTLKSELKSLQEEVTVLKEEHKAVSNKTSHNATDANENEQKADDSHQGSSKKSQDGSKHGSGSDSGDGHGDKGNSSHTDGTSSAQGDSKGSQGSGDHASQGNTGHAEKSGNAQDQGSSGGKGGDTNTDAGKGQDSSSKAKADKNHPSKALIEADVLFPATGDSAARPRTVKELLRRLVQKE